MTYHHHHHRFNVKNVVMWLTWMVENSEREKFMSFRLFEGLRGHCDATVYAHKRKQKTRKKNWQTIDYLYLL